MEYDKKSLKIAAKIAAAAFSESEKLDTENAEKTVRFLKTVYKEATLIGEDKDCEKIVLKAAGKITACAFEETENPNGETAAKFLHRLYEEIVPIAKKDDFDEDVFKCAARITASACEETENPTEETALKAAGFLKAVYASLTEEEKASCGGKYSVKESENGWSFRLLAGNNRVIGVSEIYSGKAAMEKGIEAVRKIAPEANLEDRTGGETEKAPNPKFEIYADKAGEFRFCLKARNGEIILVSEGYKTKASCENGVESVRKNSSAKIAE